MSHYHGHMHLPLLYPIVNLPDFEDPLDYISRLFAYGITFVQLRDKESEARLFSIAQQAVKMANDLREHDGTDRLVIINDSASVCRSAQAHGLHIGQGDIDPRRARSLIGPDKILGLSAHALEHAAKAPLDLIDYFGFGPIFPTATKVCSIEETGLPLLAEFCSLTTKPVVAIGGITAQTAQTVFEHGAKSLAVISALAQADNLEAEIRKFDL